AIRTVLAIAAVLCITSAAFAQYPHIPQEIQQAANEQKAAADKRSDEIFAKDLPRIEADAKNSKPYIPSAAKPSDLPQAKIPAFPGADGGGMYSCDERDGK